MTKGEVDYYLAGLGGGGGEANTGSNVGAGTGLFKDKAGVDLRFKTIVAGAGVSLTEAANTVTLDVTPAASQTHIKRDATGNYTIPTDTDTVMVKSDAPVLTLPAASAYTAGRTLIIVDDFDSGNNAPIQRAGSDTINGTMTEIILSQQLGNCVRLQTTTTGNWIQLNN